MEGSVKFKYYLVVTLLFFVALSVRAEVNHSSYYLEEGETRIISIEPGSDILISDESVVDVHVLDNSRAILRGVGVGKADIWLKSEEVLKELKVMVTASLELSLEGRLEAISEAEQALNKTEKSGLTVLSGKVSKRNYDELEKISENHEEILNLTESFQEEPPMLTLRVNILETKHQYLEDLGIRWQGTTSGPTFSSSLSGLFEWDAEINSQLMLMQRRGLAKLLANPVLSTQSGEKATFLAGGELPIPQVVAQGMQDVTFREYGIRLVIQPVVLDDNRIKTQLHAELSNIDPAVSVSGVPGILSRRTESVFLSNDGDTLVLSGLLSTDESAQDDEIPGLGSLPILENAFRSQQNREQTTELIIMVTAERMDTAKERLNDKQKRLAQKHDWYQKDSVLQLRETFR
ncbi:pilus assembly protein N-terminal domain-containing protein [Idiomarina sp. M1R2S28]|uniref:Pilus assembly protein N-terminal domain-containing protein n=1 Tax=Idiomarina rhizosphaerae TaxID=2961572 RepID=A0A9X2G1Y2_9GAMM|nr:pilus assembly protein N-terminal domain-containing protein [Idiomarina rhizosphaerae]MCP1339711.1 pilus assembly protein N-terminal domain-containing protein [Idiomarina rhizosphaerae]